MSAKKFPYVVILKNTTDKPFTLLAILLNLASVVFFAKEFVFNRDADYIRILGLAVLVGMLVWNFVKSRKGRKACC